MESAKRWLPPGKNCGLCGEESCRSFLKMVNSQRKEYSDCPYYQGSRTENYSDILQETRYSAKDVLGNEYDFILRALPGEPSARKIVLPFRSDLVEKMNIRTGDYVLGRPAGAGCPVQHILQVIKAEPLTGLLTTWAVGPQYSRKHEVKDISAYHMIGFEGIATHIRRTPGFGERVTFLPGFCMMNLNHTGIVNMALKKTCGLHLRIEDIRILARKQEFQA